MHIFPGEDVTVFFGWCVLSSDFDTSYRNENNNNNKKGSHSFSFHKRNDFSIKESWMDLSNHYPNEEENCTMMKMWRIIWFLCARELLPL